MKVMERRLRTLEAEREQSRPWEPILDQLTTPELERLDCFLPRLLAGEPLDALDDPDRELILRMDAMRWEI